MTLDILQRPKAFHTGLVGVIGAMGGVKGRNNAKQQRIFGFERCCQCGGGAVLDSRNQLPLVDQVGIAAQRRGAPRIARHAQARVGQGFGAHTHFHARRQCRLAAVNARHAQISQQLAPVVVHQNHAFGHHQIQGFATSAYLNDHIFCTIGRSAFKRGITFQMETVIGTTESFGLAAYHFALGF